MNKRHLLRTTLAFAAGAALACSVQAQQWKPTKPINLIVPWAAGGSTDQVTRVTAAELEKVLGQKIVIVNQPGASGSIGTKGVWDAPRDGYTWAAGAAQDLGVYQALGMLDVPAKDWHLFLSVANVPVVGAHAGGPYQSMPQLLEAMRAKPGQIKVSTGGVASSSFNA
ncbi:MAG: tripartite tricarboxylate transporter substrate-binding protein, partial [Rubrivivax sp.]|nr:tripartite tricarboxylate transporter substrate-binding protein [Rubrivivax sp.]